MRKGDEGWSLVDLRGSAPMSGENSGEKEWWGWVCVCVFFWMLKSCYYFVWHTLEERCHCRRPWDVYFWCSGEFSNSQSDRMRKVYVVDTATTYCYTFYLYGLVLFYSWFSSKAGELRKSGRSGWWFVRVTLVRLGCFKMGSKWIWSQL